MSESPDSGIPTTPTPSKSASVRRLRIASYEILRLIGEGGMGRVYEAEQTGPLKRRVALKLIRGGFDSEEIVARFESERRILALMTHPNVARVYDAGTTDEGHPYFVMEFVDGVPLLSYCDSSRATLDQRLDLFLQICEAIQHAHQKGVIHRDIKPSNVLVSIEQGKPIPKVIDFGIARATAPRPGERTLTRTGQYVGTPAYMSPEQLHLASDDIDTRTDVYALGVLLYLLFTGVLPFEAPGGNLDDFRSRVRDQDPLRPSARVRQLQATATETARDTAAARQTDLRGHVRQLVGDLDWITLKALEKHRERRYSTVAEFAADILRHRHDEPVLAGPPDTSYRIRKFVRRHRVGVVTSALIGAAITLGGIGTTLGLLRSQRAEALARAETEATRRVSEFLVGIFETGNPTTDHANKVTAREILDHGARQVRMRLGKPEIEARLMDTIGRVYENLGLYAQADTLLREALAVRFAERGRNHPEVAQSLAHLGELRLIQGRLAQGQDLLERALVIQERTLEREALEVGWTEYFLAVALARQGRSDPAIASLERARRIFIRRLGPQDVAVAWCHNDLGNLLRDRGLLAEAVPHYMRAVEIKQAALGSDHYDVAVSLSNVGMALMEEGMLAEAESYLRKAAALTERILGPHHLQTAVCKMNFGELIWRRGERSRGRSMVDSARVSLERIQGPIGPDVAAALHTLGSLEEHDDRIQEALSFYQRELSVRKSQLEPDAPELVRVQSRIAALEQLAPRRMTALRGP